MEIKIVTWNMSYWSRKIHTKEAWKYYLNEIDADFHFFQEANPSNTMKNESHNLIWHKIGDNRNWGSGIYSKKHKIVEEFIDTDFIGSFVVAKSYINEKELTLISLYGLMENSGTAKGFAITNLHRMLSDLTGLFWGKIDTKRNIILGGDLNANIQVDKIQKGNSHKIFFDRLEDFGLNDCFKLTDKPYPVQTLRHIRSDKKWQNDYFFISDSISKNLISCEIIDNKNVRKFSDHNPVIVTLKI